MRTHRDALAPGVAMDTLPARADMQLDTDSRIAGALVALYFALVFILLPASQYPRMVGGGLAVFAAVAGVAQVMGRGKVHGLSVLAIAFGSFALLVLPTIPAPRVVLPVGFVGAQAAVLLWGARRWPPRPRAERRTSLAEAWKTGAFVAGGLSLIATIPIVFALMDGGGDGPFILLVYPGYLMGMLGAATVYWLLQGVEHLASGRYLMGLLGGFCCYGAIGPVVEIVNQAPFDLVAMLAVTAMCGGIAGPALALDTGS